MTIDEMVRDQDQQSDRLPAWRAWLPAFAQIRYAAELKLDLAIDGEPEPESEIAIAAEETSVDINAGSAMDIEADAPAEIEADVEGDVEPGDEAEGEPDDEANDDVDVGLAAEVSQQASPDELPATSMRQGMGLVFVTGLVAGFLPFLADWYWATLAGTSVALAGLVPQATMPDAFARDLFPALTVWIDTAATIGGLDPVGPGWLAAFLSALGNWISWPLNWLSAWIVYGLGVLVVAKLLGAPTTLQHFYAGVSYAFVPLLLLALTPIPCFGALLALAAGIWALVVYVMAVRVVTGFDTLRSFVSVVAPAIVVLLIGALFAGAGVFSILSVLL